MNERNYDELKGKWFVFFGENATTGTPNARTGRMSYYGSIYGAKSKAEAKQIETEYRGTGFCKAGTARSLRKYCLGISVQSYLETLHCIPDYSDL